MNAIKLRCNDRLQFSWINNPLMLIPSVIRFVFFHERSWPVRAIAFGLKLVESNSYLRMLNALILY